MIRISQIFGAAAVVAWLAAAGPVLAHCDTMTGPVIPEARDAFARGDVTPALKWVQPEHEAELVAAFDDARRVAAAGGAAADLAERHFLETLTRLHRLGEGAPYTGLKDEPPAGVIALADASLASGSPDALIAHLQEQLDAAVRARFAAAHATGATQAASVAAGREFVDAYVQYVHHVEGLEAAIAPAAHHQDAAAACGHAAAAPAPACGHAAAAPEAPHH